MRYLVLSCSLNPKSRSRILARIVHEHLARRPGGAEFVDLQEYDLPLSDGGVCYSHGDVAKLAPKVQEAKGIIVATAIYNYDVNAAAKNLLELTGRAWEGKVVGFICAAGGHGSYMSVMPFANSLMLDYRCHIIPRFVYAAPAHIDEETFGDQAVNRRIEDLAVETQRLTDALFPEA
ncbi:MAG TPA: NAD(P)H-dependent oxidoreductase [Chthoniobacteraceae bacterium]|jgi:FMN reductase|nr:NAD(P)H-dependent oxidoreductase [Chthoniobacteraceae bacterium]